MDPLHEDDRFEDVRRSFSSGDDRFEDHSQSFSSSDDDLPRRRTRLNSLMLLALALKAYLIALESFQSIELSRESQRSINRGLGVSDVLARLFSHPIQFRNITNFMIEEFQELSHLVVPIIEGNARSTGAQHHLSGQPPKLSPQQRLLCFILYLKHDNTLDLDGQQWNWAKSAICDDAIFIGSCINEAISEEIRWPSPAERLELGRCIPQLSGCIGMVDGTLVRIKKPYENPQHSCWFNGRKKMYCMNSTVLIDHHGFFIHVDAGYPGSYHDVTILAHSNVDQNWRDLFVNTPDYVEYVLGDSGYVGKETYILRGFNRTEIRTLHLNNGLVRAFNKMHAGYRVKVECGIGGLKMKWKRLGKRWDLYRPRFKILFHSATLLTNFLHRRRKDMTVQIEGARVHPTRAAWAGDI